MKFRIDLLLVALLGLLPFAQAKNSKPNFVVIFIDDMGYGDIEPFGSKVNQTPHLNQMAKEGMKLTSFYAAPVCSASRAQLLTGCYAPRVSVPGVFFPAGKSGLNPDEKTIADYLKELGYATACVGKWHIGDQVEFLPTRQGFDSYFGIPYSNDMQRTSSESGKRVTPLLRDEKVAELLEDEGQRRITREYTEEAISFIKRESENEKPFFLYLPHTAMHVPLFPHEEFVGASTNGIYGDWAKEVDWSVGKILEALRSSGVEEETLVIFTSDNGPWASKGKAGGVSGPLRGAKGCTLEGGVRVPTIAWWPGRVKPGSVSDAISGTPDLLPTFVSLAGGRPDASIKIDGYDLTQVLDGKAEQTKREAWYYFGGNTLQAVRSGSWKLAVTAQSIGMGFKEKPEDLRRKGRLYNLDDEIGEKTDVSAKHPEVVARLTAMAKAMELDMEKNKRPVGLVENPVMLYPSSQKRKNSVRRGKLVVWSKVEPGEVFSSGQVPDVVKKPFTILGGFETKDKVSEVLMAHGGTQVGYGLYLKDANLVFAVSTGKGHLERIQASVDPGKVEFLAGLDVNGRLFLKVGERQPIQSDKGNHWITRVPAENFSVGFDDGHAVDSQAPKSRFSGKLLKIRVKAPSK
ncbi:MAG: sulfatase [Akkermansiaceae bacterium]